MSVPKQQRKKMIEYFRTLLIALLSYLLGKKQNKVIKNKPVIKSKEELKEILKKGKF